MPAYTRGNLGPAAYLERVLSGLCRQMGGELRVKGELVDMPNEPTTLVFAWDPHTQELIIRGAKQGETFLEMFRVTPESTAPAPAPPRVVDPLDRTLFRERDPLEPRRPSPEPPTPMPTRSNVNPLDDGKLTGLEKKRQAARAAALLRDYLAERNRESPIA